MDNANEELNLDNFEESFEEELELQVKSKDRVKDHGEVFTNKREVNAMLDLVADEASRVDSRFLEPACGTGNFLVEILNRKLETVRKDYSEYLDDLQKYTFIAIGSIYAIDIQEDNCIESRKRMFDIVKEFHLDVFPEGPVNYFLDAIRQILEMNIILGNGLTGLQVDKDNLDGYADRPIVFSEWTFNDDIVTRLDFSMNDMIKYNLDVEKSKKGLEKNNDINNALMNRFSIANKSEMKEIETLNPISRFLYSSYKEISDII